MTSNVGFTSGRPPQWDLERFLRGDEVDTAAITLERNRRTFAWKCADVGAEGLALRLGATTVTLGGLLEHLAWVEELYFQVRLAGRPPTAPFDELDLDRDWNDWPWSTAAGDAPETLRALWIDSVHRSRDALAEVLARGGLEQTTPAGMSLRRLLADMVEEYARHTGHADLLREEVDGTTGEGPPPDLPGALKGRRRTSLRASRMTKPPEMRRVDAVSRPVRSSTSGSRRAEIPGQLPGVACGAGGGGANTTSAASVH